MRILLHILLNLDEYFSNCVGEKTYYETYDGRQKYSQKSPGDALGLFFYCKNCSHTRPMEQAEQGSIKGGNKCPAVIYKDMFE